MWGNAKFLDTPKQFLSSDPSHFIDSVQHFNPISTKAAVCKPESPILNPAEPRAPIALMDSNFTRTGPWKVSQKR